MSSASRSFLLATTLLLSAALLRVYQIDAQSIWADEGFTYLVTQQSDMLPMLRADVHPPLYFAAMKVWTAAAGTSEFALRLPSALASLVSVALVYLLGRELVRWRGGNPDASPVPLVAALLMTLSDLEIDLSHEARMYTIHTALALFVVFSYVRYVRLQQRRNALALGLSSAVLVYVNYLGAWTPIVVGLHAVAYLRGKRLRVVISALATAAILLVPWLALVGKDQIGNGAGADRADATTLDTLRTYVSNWLGQQWPLMAGLFLLGTITLEVGARVRVQLRQFRVTALLLLWVLVPLVLTTIANIWIPVLAAHRVSQITPAICLLIAFGLANIQVPARGFLVAVIAVSSLTSVDFYRIKGPWQAYTDTIAPFVESNHLVLMEIGGGDTMLEYYFDRSLPPGTWLVSLKRWREGTPDDFYAGILPLLDAQETVWLLHWSSESTIFEWLGRLGFVQTMRRETMHIQNSRLDSYRFDRLPSEPVATLGRLRLRRADISNEPARVDLFWAIDRPVDDVIVTSAFLLDDAGAIVAQHDSQPMLNERPTPSWLPGESIYDPKRLVTPDGAPIPAGTYRVGVVAYRFEGDRIIRLIAPDGQDRLLIGMITVPP